MVRRRKCGIHGVHTYPEHDLEAINSIDVWGLDHEIEVNQPNSPTLSHTSVRNDDPGVV